MFILDRYRKSLGWREKKLCFKNNEELQAILVKSYDPYYNGPSRLILDFVENILHESSKLVTTLIQNDAKYSTGVFVATGELEHGRPIYVNHGKNSHTWPKKKIHFRLGAWSLRYT